MNIFVWKLSKIYAQKKVFFFTFFGLLRFLVFFNGLFSPTSRSRMSNIFRDLESLRKSNGKKWSKIWTFLFVNCQKLQRKKKFFSLIVSLLRYPLTVFLPPLLKSDVQFFLEIQSPWGKVMERNGLRSEHVCLKIVKNRSAKKKFFFADFALQNMV